MHLLPAPPQPAGSARFAGSVGVGPVTVPEHLDRLQLVSRTASGSIAISDTQRWAEPLPAGLTRVLADTLSTRLGAGRVVLFPWPRSRAPDLRVPVQVLHFESGPDGIVHLEARWSVERADGTVRVAARTSRIEVPSAAAIETRIRAHGEAAAALGREIADAVREAAE